MLVSVKNRSQLIIDVSHYVIICHLFANMDTRLVLKKVAGYQFDPRKICDTNLTLKILIFISC